MTKLLAFDTSTDACTVAISCNGDTRERFEIAPRRHTDLLLPMIDELLAEAEIKLSQLDAIVFGCGPGSFMGLRLAAGVAQGLAYAANLPVISISSLQSLAQHAYSQLGAKHIVAGWDARMSEIYWGCFSLGDNELMLPQGEDQVSKPSVIRVPQHQPWVLAGNAWQVYQADLPASLQLESHLLHPHAAASIKLAEHAANGDKAFGAQPNYLRPGVSNCRT